MKKYAVKLDGELLYGQEIADEDLKDFISTVGFVSTLHGQFFEIIDWETGEVVASTNMKR